MVKNKKESNSLIEFVKTLVFAIIVAVLFRSFLFEPFNIPSSSMLPNLLIGDYIFVSKYSYGYSKHSFPFSVAPIKGRIFSEKPERGDVAVFKLPSDTSINYIKRVIGIPGDKVQMKKGKLYLNGKNVPELNIGKFNFRYKNNFQQYEMFEQIIEGRSYKILNLGDNQYLDNTIEFIVPKNHYFMMGDNRDNSQDSRVGVGFVHHDNFVGEAQFIFFSLNGKSKIWEIWNWPKAIRYSRIFSSIN